MFDFFGTRATVYSLIRTQRDLERRVKRLELMLAREAESRLANLKDEKMGEGYLDGFQSIEELIKGTGGAPEPRCIIPCPPKKIK